MMIIGCDFHPSWQQIAWLDTETGETAERRLAHADGDAERFYRQLPAPVLIGMEATGNSHWLAELGHELWVGDSLLLRWRGGPFGFALGRLFDFVETSLREVSAALRMTHGMG
jgi:hypothetical protein